MNTQFFAGCTTVEEVKALYKKLAMQHHPDRGGDTATMQEVNRQYHEALKGRHGQQGKTESGKEYTYYYKQAAEQAVVDKIDQVLKSGVLTRIEDAEFYLVGSWLWIVGETYPHRKDLGGLGFTWHSMRQSWVWHEKPYKGKPNPGSREDIFRAYGAERIKPRDEEKAESRREKALA